MWCAYAVVTYWNDFIDVIGEIPGLHPSQEYKVHPRKVCEWLGVNLWCLCVSLCLSLQSFWLIQLGNAVPFLFSLFMSNQRIEDCKTSAYCVSYCIHPSILGKVDCLDARNQNNASLQQSSWGSFDLANNHRSCLCFTKRNFKKLFYIKAKCSHFYCVKFFSFKRTLEKDNENKMPYIAK